MENEIPEKVQKALVALCQGAVQGDKKAIEQIQGIMKAAKDGNQEAVPVASFIVSVLDSLKKQQVQSAKLGGQLDYLRRLRTGAGIDEHVVYQRWGGRVNKKIVKKFQNGTSMTESAPVRKRRSLFGN